MGASDKIIRDAIWDELHPAIELDETRSEHSWTSGNTEEAEPAHLAESSGEMIARDPNKSAEWLETHNFKAIARFTQSNGLPLVDVLPLSMDELSHLGLPEGEANRFVQIAANSGLALFTPSQTAGWLSNNHLAKTSRYFADHSLDGVDMLYMLPSDMLKDNIPLEECQRFARLVARGDAANWLHRNHYPAMSKVARVHDLTVPDFEHIRHPDLVAYGVPDAEIDRFLKFFGNPSDNIV